MSGERAQKFGGYWSLLKVEAVESYLRAYETVMSRQPFELVYIDSFAGSGFFTFGESMPLMGETEAARVFAGSVKRALEVRAFTQLFFFEADRRNLASLRAIAGHDQRVSIVSGDANVELPALCRRLDWRRRRGVVFVDPCGPETNWTILRAIASTKALDMFWLFPLSAVYRNVPHEHAKLTPEKHAMVSRCLDGTDWEHRFYGPPGGAAGDLFTNAPKMRRVDVAGIEEFALTRLKTIFPYVEKPARLLGPTGAPLFDLFFGIANPSAAAWRVASPIARHLLDSI